MARLVIEEETVKAIVYTEYGPPDVLRLKEVATPVPRDGQLLVKVYASSVNYSDWAFLSGKRFEVRMVQGLRKPKVTILGKDVAGRVEAVGRNVDQFQPGDEVYGDLSEWGFGAFAEYVAVPEAAVAPKPANMTFIQSAAVPEAAVVALQGVRTKGEIRPGQKVLIVGASGGIGTFAVQFAKAFGAEVTGVCSTRNLELVRSLGADHVIDYVREDFVQSGRRYDLIVATAGYRSIFDYRRALKPQGIYVETGGAFAQIYQALLLGPLLSRSGRQQMRSLMSKPNQKDLLTVKELIEEGKVAPVIDRCYPLPEVAEALGYYGKGRSRGKVVITVAESS